MCSTDLSGQLKDTDSSQDLVKTSEQQPTRTVISYFNRHIQPLHLSHALCGGTHRFGR